MAAKKKATSEKARTAWTHWPMFQPLGLLEAASTAATNQRVLQTAPKAYSISMANVFDSTYCSHFDANQSPNSRLLYPRSRKGRLSSN